MKKHLTALSLILILASCQNSLNSKVSSKVMPWYARRFGPASSFKKEAVLIRSRQDYDRALKNYRAWREQFLEADGSLREPFQPAKLEAVFAGDPSAVTERSAIPVPKGPVETW